MQMTWHQAKLIKNVTHVKLALKASNKMYSHTSIHVICHDFWSIYVDGFWIFLKFTPQMLVKCEQFYFTATGHLSADRSIDHNFYRNRSWPAVSQIWSLTDFPPTFTTLLPNSTPMVWFESFLTENSKDFKKSLMFKFFQLYN